MLILDNVLSTQNESLSVKNGGDKGNLELYNESSCNENEKEKMEMKKKTKNSLITICNFLKKF